MTPRQGIQGKVIASSIALVLMLQPFAGAQDPPLPSAVPNNSQPAAPPAPAPDVADPSAAPATPAPSAAPLPDSPGTLQQAPNSQPVTTPATQSSSPADDLATDRQQEASQRSPDSAAPAQPQQTSPHEPRGTAAAESIQATGVAASRPAGAAVAPAKQRRVRSILIKLGAVVGVGVAVGTTMALSQGSPSRPPGAR